MRIVIAGAGTVGYLLAKTLSFNHDVIIVDQQAVKLERLRDELDVLTCEGNAEDPKTYKKLEIAACDLFVSVTDADEVNLLAPLVAQEVLAIEKTIVRLKNEDFLRTRLLSKLSIDDAVFPDMVTAQRVKALLRHPKANNVKTFHQTACKLMSYKVASLSQDLRVDDVCRKDVRVAAIERDRRLMFPSGKERIERGDLLYFFGCADAIEAVRRRFETGMPDAIANVVLFGADTLALKIAKAVAKEGVALKIIDKHAERCRRALDVLGEKAMVIHSAFEDHKLFEEEGLKYADMVIAATADDETNIVKCVEAGEYGIAKRVAVNNDPSYYGLMHQLGIVAVRGSKAGAHYAILEKIASSQVTTQRHFCGGEGVMFLRKIYPSSPLIGKRIGRYAKEKVLTFLIRQERFIEPEEAGVFKSDDVLAVFAPSAYKEVLQRWIDTL